MIIHYTHNKQPDFIGDIHGHFDALEILFKKMGYEKKNGIYSHTERFPVFIGDYIDRGPKIIETLQLVRAMQENDAAIALMGNHEFNFLCFHHTDEKGNAFRENSEKNLEQLIKTKTALNASEELESYLNWMASLPIAINNNDFRAVHAQWNEDAVELLNNSGINKLDETGLRTLYHDSDLLEKTELLLKGFEIKGLPEHLHYYDAEKHKRTDGRIKWWKETQSNKFGDIFASLPEEVYHKDIAGFTHEFREYYKSTDKPVFFGHYWLNPADFGLASENSCCVDFSIAKEGVLSSYRFSGETILNSKNLVKHND